MSAAAKLLTDRAHVYLFVLRMHAYAHLTVSQLFKKNRYHDSANRAEMIDQAFIILGNNLQLRRRFQAQAETGDTAFAFKAHCAQQFAQQFNSPARKIFVNLSTDRSNIDTRPDQLRRDLKGPCRRVWILKRTSVGADRDVKIFSDITIERKFLIFDQLEEDLPGRRCDWIDINKIAVAWIARVMVDVN